jgi:hypothetical protein
MQDKKSNIRISIKRIIIGVIIVLAVLYFTRYLIQQNRINRFNEVVSEYLQIDNYQDARDLYERDLHNNELKYFTYGLAYFKPYYRKLKRKYDLEVFFMGCIIEGRLSKYNFYVEENILSYEDKERNYFNKADSIWTYFIEALDTKDYDYLTLNANDTVFVSTGLLNDSLVDNFEARFLFEQFSDSLASFDYLSTNSSDHNRDSLIYYFRKIEHLNSDKEPFNLRFSFIRMDERYCLNEIVIL